MSDELDTTQQALWALQNRDKALRALDKIDAESSLYQYMRVMWPVLEPSRPLVKGWVLEVICEHLEAITNGQIRRLVIAVPPGSSKSLLSSVFWPSWEWGPRSLPSTRYIKAAYSEGLTIRDNRKAMMLIDSPLYQSMWGDRFKMDPTQQAKTKFENLSTGWMLATSVGGTGTGERGDRFIIDDPHSVQKADSEARRIEALQWFTEVVPTRVNDPDKSAMLTIMQRVHEDDVVGHILEHKLNWDMLCIPMRYESDHPTKSRTALNFVDPRTIDGELMWPDRFSEAYLSKDLEPNLRSWGGEYAVASQLQQRPAPRGGGMFLRDKIQIIDPQQIPQSAGGRVARGWDLAATKDGTAAFTACVRVRITSNGDIYIEDVRRERLSPNEVYKLITSCAEQDGLKTKQSLPQDPGQAGKSQKAHIASLLAGYIFEITTESGAKEDRARPLAAQVEAGKVYLSRAPWNAAFLAELAMFPAGKYKDQVDAASRAYGCLIRSRPRRVAATAPRLIDGSDS